MLDIKTLRAAPEAAKAALARRGREYDLDGLLALDARRLDILAQVEALKNERNTASAEVARAKRQGGDASALLARMSDVAARIKALDEELAGVAAAVSERLAGLPNIPHVSTPDGRDERDNPVERLHGAPTEFDFPPRDHVDIGLGLGGLDLERAAKLTGARFSVLRGPLARLERALAALMLDIQTGENGYTEIIPPYVVNSASLFGTGQLPKFGEDLFHLEGTDYYLIPTAEVPLTNLHRDEILKEEDLPVCYCALTPCFRSEAGSYGKDTRGLIRQHQFHKVELVRFVHPEASYNELERLTGHAESVLRRLELPYRVVSLCAGDLGFGSAKTYDLEVWLPGQGAYREISSCSVFEDFQARRAAIRFRPASAKKPVLLHTLNGSGLAVGRTLCAVLENGQRRDGSVVLPKALVPYMGGLEVLEPAG